MGQSYAGLEGSGGLVGLGSLVGLMGGWGYEGIYETWRADLDGKGCMGFWQGSSVSGVACGLQWGRPRHLARVQPTKKLATRNKHNGELEELAASSRQLYCVVNAGSY